MNRVLEASGRTLNVATYVGFVILCIRSGEPEPLGLCLLFASLAGVARNLVALGNLYDNEKQERGL